MAILQVLLHSAGASGTASPGGKGTIRRSYRSRYRVQCDTTQDAPTQIHNHFKANPATLPWIGRQFKWGNGRDTDVSCTALDAEYIEKSGGWYDVKATFEPPTGGGEEPQTETIEGGTSDDPLREPDQIEVGYTQFSKPVERAIYRGATAGTSKWLKNGKSGPITNSAGVPLDPQPEEEQVITIIRITKVIPTYVGALYDLLKGVVNNDAFVINKPLYGFSQAVPKYCGKIHGISATFHYENKVKFFRRTAELHIHPSAVSSHAEPLGWRREALDVGRTRSRIAGDKVGDGDSTALTTAQQAALAASAGTFHAAVRDTEGYPIGEPVLFDGTGKPKSETLPPVYLTWQTRPETAFAGLNFLW